MLPYTIESLAVLFGQHSRLQQRMEDLPVKKLVPHLPLKLSAYPFSHGDPGSMYSVFAPTFPSHLRTALAVNSGPLSEEQIAPALPWLSSARRGFQSHPGTGCCALPE